MKKSIYCILGALFFLLGCSGIEKEQLTGDYYLTKLDYSDSELDISFKLKESDNFIGVIPAKIIEVGFNNNFIIVKQQPKGKHDYRFYIIPLTNRIHHSPDENKIGPLIKEEFEIKRKELNVPKELIFTRKFE